MQKITLFFCIIFSSLFSLKNEAQISVTLFPEPAKQFFIDDLWKTIIINAGSSNASVYIQFTISTQANSAIVTVTSPVENFSKGLNHLSSADGSSGKWTYNNSEAAAILQQTGRLPFGNYVFCANVFSANTNKILGSDCEERDVKPISPPQLANPYNKEEISITNPVLVWLPPRPLEGLAVTYSLRLVQVDTGQSSSQALLQNPALLNQNGLNNTTLLYPADAPPLETGSEYAWQVAASYEGYDLGVTDMWTFKIKQPVYTNTDEIIYPVAEKKNDGRYYVSHGIVRFAYDNKANDGKLNYTIRGIDKTDGINSLPEVDLNSGVNKVEVNLKNVLQKGEYYALEIRDSQSQVYKLTFYYPE